MCLNYFTKTRVNTIVDIIVYSYCMICYIFISLCPYEIKNIRNYVAGGTKAQRK